MWPDGGSGIHVALKMPWPFGLAGSSPARATIYFNQVGVYDGPVSSIW